MAATTLSSFLEIGHPFCMTIDYVWHVKQWAVATTMILAAFLLYKMHYKDNRNPATANINSTISQPIASQTAEFFMKYSYLISMVEI